MCKEKIIIKYPEIEDVLFSWSGRPHKEFDVIDLHYEYHGCDHDLWEFDAIVQRKFDGKFFKVRWYDAYIGMWEYTDKGDEFELIEVTPIEKLLTVYE